ncbi:MAG: multiprotein-bridging factor 1 family protein [Anaerolineales bacterium]
MDPRLTSEYVARIREAHQRSGLSSREVAVACDMDHSYVSRTLNGERVPHRDVLISLCPFAWKQSRLETDEILLLAGIPPLGRSALREFRHACLTHALVEAMPRHLPSPDPHSAPK